MEQPTAAGPLRALEPLVGEWTIEAAGPDGQPWPGRATSSFGWHPSGAHLVQRTSTDVAGAPDSTSIIGCDAAKGSFVQLYSDDRGVCRIYAMRFDGREWVLERDGDPFPQRFVGVISDDAGTIAGRWEKAENGADFAIDFTMTYRRVTAPGQR
ncbi:MAG: hypothetical protein ACR2FU_23470 [Streptosporangiaceae bacterium]